jgi:hypothetical protein
LNEKILTSINLLWRKGRHSLTLAAKSAFRPGQAPAEIQRQTDASGAALACPNAKLRLAPGSASRSSGSSQAVLSKTAGASACI